MDADYPQHTCYKWRSNDLAILKSEDAGETSQAKFEEQGIPPYDIIPCDINPGTPNIPWVVDVISALQDKPLDYVFVDLPGTLNNPNLEKIIRTIEYIFIPLQMPKRIL